MKKTTLEHATAWKSLPPNTKVWLPPEKGFFKINFDTIIRDNFSTQVAVCRDSNGRIIKAISQISPACSPNFDEALELSL
jgi:hypothetical protein